MHTVTTISKKCMHKKFFCFILLEEIQNDTHTLIPLDYSNTDLLIEK